LFRCPVDEKLISRFRGSWSETGVYETQVFAYMKTFRFTGSPALYVECDVRMCHGKCPVSVSQNVPSKSLLDAFGFYFAVQNQPCHWRNAKSVSRRSLPDTLLEATQAPQLSENISLFQSLRVLQEGESGDEEATQLQSKIGELSFFFF
jgi:Zona pellucida-like domain